MRLFLAILALVLASAAPARALDAAALAKRPPLAGKSLEAITVTAPGAISGGRLAVTGGDAPLDLISGGMPTSGTWVTQGSLMAEPILGPFWSRDGSGNISPALVAQDLTRAGLARYYTASQNSDKGEYANLFNMNVTNGYPGNWTPNTVYKHRSTVVHGGNMYVVKDGTYGGTSGNSGGPTGTTPGVDIPDGTVTWRYEPNKSPANGGKTNLGVFTYAEDNAGATWGVAVDTQISQGDGRRINVYSQEIDLVNYRTDYGVATPGGVATALQIFMNGPRRSSSGLSIAGLDDVSDPAHVVNGITLCCDKLVSDNGYYDLTHAGTAIRLGGTYGVGLALSGSFSGFQIQGPGWNVNPFGDITHHSLISTGAQGVGLTFAGTYANFQINGQGWNVNPMGVITASGIVMTGGLKLAPYTVSTLYPCVSGSEGTMAYVTDATAVTYNAVPVGGGNLKTPVFCDGTSWKMR
ncbi:hypothetical protein [Methylobacterium nodulans]|uniref:Uncharacterized protein n=1 Tax=Methylobacterium nodulans (strain LMG 21967 / CNCM I-2342 / ORS 2060) TaxID=460265 RepID=B8ICJ8_METNO|nr:hypothetical protein [Methylobacterium nodulans]ACL57409.1 hypothetical protein Mnod_2439 [Methylobacterium nodulans ORS 2060]